MSRPRPPERDPYLDGITREPLLNRVQEFELARSVHEARAARQRMARGSYDPSSLLYLMEVIRAGQRARERLVMANTRLVISIAKRYRDRGLPISDLVQEGIVGLIRAIGKFEPGRGIRFSTYATWWIRQAMTRALDNHGRTIRLPVHIRTQLVKLSRRYRDLSQALGHAPTHEEQAKAMGLPTEEVRQLLRMGQPELSLENPLDVEQDQLLGDRLYDRGARSPEELAELNLARDQIQRALNALPSRQAQVLRLRFGFHDGRPRTLQGVGDQMGITRERVRQIQEQALVRLREDVPGLREIHRSYSL